MHRQIAPLLVMSLVLAAAPMTHADHVDGDDIDWRCGFGGGHPDDCGIDPVGGGEAVNSDGEPTFKSAGNDDWIADDARVIGIVHGGDARAYPVRMLNRHEIVNDVVGGDPLTITLCPLCGSGVSFLRQLELDGVAVQTNFTASGYLFRTDLVMWDPESNQLWNQITGTPIAWLDEDRPVAEGHASMQLEFIPTTVTAWKAWKENHPDTLLLQPVFSPSSYPENAYSVTEPDNCQHGLSGESDCDVGGLHPKEQVIGVNEGDTTIAFPVRLVAAEPDRVAVQASGGRTVVAAVDRGGGGVLYDGGTRNFSIDEDGVWRDRTGAAWDLADGRRADGGVTLPPLPSTHMFWFAWEDHHPDTDVWLPEGFGQIEETEEVGAPGFGLVGAAATLLAALALRRRTRKQL